jgi:RNA-directed DNA polymerase
MISSITGKGIKIPEKLDSLRQKLYQKAKNEPRFRFYTLFDHLCREDVLDTAWKLVKRNKGAPGIDGVSLEDIESREDGVEGFLLEIKESLLSRKYKPRAVKRVYVPKPNGGLRPLGIPTVRDRVVQAAARLVIEPIFEADFCECSYGFRPGRSQHDALEEVRKALEKGHREVYDIDLQEYFDTIPHDKLMKCVHTRITDGRILKLIRMWLKVAVVEEDENGKKRTYRSDKGTPQGGVISPLLSNIYLHMFDKVFHRSGGPGSAGKVKLVRFADDMLILGKTISDDTQRFTVGKLENWLELKLNQEKTKIAKLEGGQESVDFLGFTLRYDKDLRGRPQRYLNITPSDRALKRERLRIKGMTGSNVCYKPITILMTEINKHLVQWGRYYRYGYPRTAFRDINEYTRRRLGIHLKRRSQRPYRPPPEVTWYQQIGNLGFQPL